MKTKIIFIGLFALLLSSCTSPKYLPNSENIDINKYGSYINIARNTKPDIDGELIAIDSNSITILKASTKKCKTIPMADVKRFELQYAAHKKHGWAIPFFSLLTLSHGVGLIATLPINLIVTISVAAGGKKSFTYSKKKMTYDKLKMFARFPQGIPAHIDMDMIK